jgi:methyltransferase (TIGR00027 family)
MMRSEWGEVVEVQGCIQSQGAAMEGKGPRTTAQGVALHRAAHQIIDEPRVFDDPMAVRVIGAEAASALKAAPQQYHVSHWAGVLRAFITARSRYTEDELGAAVKRGVRQYVILGAGLDTFAYRNPYPPEALRVFEVDHPSTQQWKRTRLEESGIVIPGSLKFVPVDFETRTLAEGLRMAKFDSDEPAFFSWLGVIQYLTKDAIFSTFQFIAGLKKGTCVLSDYIIPPSLLSPQQRSVFDAIVNRAAMAGAPWITFFEPSSLTADLLALGFAQAEGMGPEEINARYFAGRKDNLSVGRFGHFMKATV